jgi:dienelactone hydrolase
LCEGGPTDIGTRTHDGKTFRVYRTGTGPAVVLLHELPGLTPCDISTACRLGKRGFSVYLPVFFGVPGDQKFAGFTLSQLLWPGSRFFLSGLLPGHTPRVRNWISGLVSDLALEGSERGVGVIGMCLTGALPVALLSHPDVRAAVLCQPTSPLLFRGALDLDPGDLRRAKERATKEGLQILGVRFSSDRLSRQERFERLGREFSSHFTELVVAAGPLGTKDAPHSVLGGDYTGKPYGPAAAEVFERVVRYLDNRLRYRPSTPDYPGSSSACDPALFSSCKTYPPPES